MKVTVTEGAYKSGTKYCLVRCVLPNGKPERRFFPDKESADRHAAYRQSESRDAMMIPEALKFEADECAKRLQPHSWTLRRATDYVVQHVIPYERKPPIGEAVQLYIQEQAARGLAKPTMSGIKHRLGVFEARFGGEHLHEQTLDDYSKWMQELSAKYEPQGVCRFLSHATSFIAWAIPRGYCATNLIPALDWPIVKSKRPVIFSICQVKTLFDAAPRHGLLAWAVLGTLDGIRPGEMQLLGRLGDVLDLTEGHIKVDHDDFSPVERRVIELEGEWGEANRAWMRRCKLENPIVPWPERRHVEALRNELGFWSHDVMRHTAASAHYALYGDVGKTMKMLGHGAKSEVFHKHYKALMTSAEAKAIYALRPS